jgi:hypothetical protein
MTHRALRVRRGAADRDPMFAPVWYDGSDMIATMTPPEPAAPLDLPPPSDLQQNDHVMRYWNWRLDRMEAKRG